MMEQQLLQDMIQERDARIVKIERQVDRQDQQLMRVTANIAKVRVKLSEDALLFTNELKELQKAKQYRKDQMARLEHSLKQQSGSLHVYAEVMKLASAEQVTSSYVTRAQAQLCRAMHTMGALEHQVVLVEDKCSKLIKSLKEQVSRVVEEKTKVELQVMNELVVLDDEKREIEAKLKEKSNQAMQEKEELQNQVGEDEEEEQVDEEEEELREMIAEGKLEIERLEQENAKQLETIQQLKSRMEQTKKPKQQDITTEETNGNDEVTKEQPQENDPRPQLDKEEKVDASGGNEQ